MAQVNLDIAQVNSRTKNFTELAAGRLMSSTNTLTVTGCGVLSFNTNTSSTMNFNLTVDGQVYNGTSGVPSKCFFQVFFENSVTLTATTGELYYIVQS